MRKRLTDEQKEANKIARKEARRAAAIKAVIDEKKNQQPVKSITINIEWRKSRMWGNNPHATAEVRYRDGSFERRDGFTCSGCGYCKESTVIAQVFNAFMAYKLYKLTKNQMIRKDYEGGKGSAPYGIREYRNGRGYDGGIGTNCYISISKHIGGKFENIASGKTFDAYKYTDKRLKP